MGTTRDGRRRPVSTLWPGTPRGDRSRRNDDRYLFLEALLSARDTLYISYVGQSMEDNSRIPPSVVVSELLDYVRRGFVLKDRNIDELLITYHPLQAFSPVCFTEESCRLFSYSEENRKAANTLLKRSSLTSIPGAEAERLPEDPAMATQATIRDLIAFFRHPARFFLQRRLAVFLGEADIVLEENEPFDVEGLDRYGIEQLLMEKEIETGHMEEVYPVLAAQGLLPHGVWVSPGSMP
jgi:exodeoxyribonuclease V gamma subunit